MSSKADRTRQHIIEKAAPFFNKKGYADTSLSDVVKATGLTKGAIYGNFENKDDLAIQVFDYNVSLLRKGLPAAMADSTSAPDKLLAMVEYYRKEYKHVAARGGCPVMNAATETDDNFPALRTRMRATIRGWRKEIADIIIAGQAANTIVKKADAQQYAILFIALIEGGIMLGKALEDPSPVHHSLDRMQLIIEAELKR